MQIQHSMLAAFLASRAHIHKDVPIYLQTYVCIYYMGNRPESTSSKFIEDTKSHIVRGRETDYINNSLCRRLFKLIDLRNVEILR